MKYPDHIYKEYSVIEKDILGVKHFALVRVYRMFGKIVYQKKQKLRDYGRDAHITSYWADTWFRHKKWVESAIRNAHNTAESRHLEKLVR